MEKTFLKVKHHNFVCADFCHDNKFGIVLELGTQQLISTTLKNISTMYRSLLLILVFLASIHLDAKGDKHALIIAVGDYQPETGWKVISSKNDVPLIQGALVSQGFEENHITVITDEQATKAGILNALDALLNTVNTGDVVVVHYSGHGQQITDDNGDEIDGYDEAMVPFDAHARLRKGVYEGENHIRDDRIGEILTALRAKVGPNGSVMLIMDSCHSGTASRGLAKTRGTQGSI